MSELIFDGILPEEYIKEQKDIRESVKKDIETGEITGDYSFDWDLERQKQENNVNKDVINYEPILPEDIVKIAYNLDEFNTIDDDFEE